MIQTAWREVCFVWVSGSQHPELVLQGWAMFGASDEHLLLSSWQSLECLLELTAASACSLGSYKEVSVILSSEISLAILWSLKAELEKGWRKEADEPLQ